MSIHQALPFHSGAENIGANEVAGATIWFMFFLLIVGATISSPALSSSIELAGLF